MKGFFTKTKIFLISTLVMISSIYHYSQDSSKIIMLSKDIGPIVELNEKLEFDILPRFKENFVSAMFYLSADSLYNCKVRLVKDNTVSDTTLILSYNSIRNSAMRVQYLESIKKGNSSFNMQNVELKFANSEQVKNLPNSYVEKVQKPEKSRTDEILVPQKLLNYHDLEDQSILGNLVEVKKISGEKIDGQLLSVNDSLISVIELSNKSDFESPNDTIKKLRLTEIYSVKIVKESKVLSSMGNGFLIGAGLGAMLGLASGDDEGYIINFSAGTKALMFGAGLGIVGAIIGVAIGSGQSEDEEIIIRNTKDLNYLFEFSREAQNYKDTANIQEPSLFGADFPLNKPETEFNKNMEISIFLATTSSGPASGIEGQMIKSGFDKTSYGSWFNAGSISHPKSHTGLGQLGTPWMITLKYYYTKNLLLGAFYSGNPIGWTTGYNNNSDYLDIYYSVSTIAAMSWYKYYNISLGLGPAIFLTNAYENNIINSNKSYKTTKIGFVVEAEINYPAQSTFFVSVITQYRFMGTDNIGPFMVNDQLALPKFNISYNHVFLGFGAGIRL